MPSYLSYLVMDLLQDRIAAVRLQAAHLAASITEHLMKDGYTNSAYSDEFIDNVCQRSDECHETRLFYFRSYHSLAGIINEEKSG